MGGSDLLQPLHPHAGLPLKGPVPLPCRGLCVPLRLYAPSPGFVLLLPGGRWCGWAPPKPRTKAGERATRGRGGVGRGGGYTPDCTLGCGAACPGPLGGDLPLPPPHLCPFWPRPLPCWEFRVLCPRVAKQPPSKILSGHFPRPLPWVRGTAPRRALRVRRSHPVVDGTWPFLQRNGWPNGCTATMHRRDVALQLV